MNNKIFILFLLITSSVFGSNYVRHKNKHPQKDKNKEKSAKVHAAKNKEKDKDKTVAVAKIDTAKVKLKDILPQLDSLDFTGMKLRLLKKNAHASYYHNKFNGRRTASGKRFDNDGYTAAHKTLPFGTKVKVTNEANGKFVIVEVTDRGPFSKAREIDLTHKAFLDIASNKNSGSIIVTIEVIEPLK